MILESINGKNLKVIFDPNQENLLIGDLVKIINKDNFGIVGQVLNIESSENYEDFNNIANVKILFSLSLSNKWVEWIGNIPSKDNYIQKVSLNELLTYINDNNSQSLIPFGNLSLYSSPNLLDVSKLGTSTLIFCEKQKQRINLSIDLANELSRNSFKTIIFDFKGEFSAYSTAVTIELGKDLKLPLNSKGIDFIYNKTLNNLSLESKSLIEDIFMEVQDYADSCEQGFIPFASFRGVVEAEYRNSKIPELLILKNSITKLEKLGIFANDDFEIESLETYIEKCDLIIVDFSTISSIWHKDFFEFIIDNNIKKNNQDLFLILEADKNHIDESLIDKLSVQAYNSGIKSIISIGYKSNLLSKLSPISENMIFCSPAINQELFLDFKPFLNKLNKNEILVYGEISGHIPIFSDLNKNVKEKYIEAPQTKSKNQPSSNEKEKLNSINGLVQNYVNYVNNENIVNAKEDVSKKSQLLPQQIEVPTVVQEEEIENFEFYQNDFEEDNITESYQEEFQPKVIKTDNKIQEKYEELDTLYSEENNRTNDKKESLNSQNKSYEAISQALNDSDPYSDIPIYSATDEIVLETMETDFQEGDEVIHQKYGQGRIKKIIGYGDKLLFSINFDGFGKKLLDPELATIQRV